jgi:hypothetical protein
MKKCPKCKKRKPYSAFYKCKARKSGYDVYCKECQKVIRRERRRNDPKYKLRYQVSNHLNNMIKTGYSSPICDFFLSVFGYSRRSLIKHLKSKLPPGYNWKDFLNQDLQVDHIKPVSDFNFVSVDCEDFKKCWSLENLQILTENENKHKGNKLCV